MFNRIINPKGFTVIELAVTLTVILIIIGISSGVYYSLISSAEEAGIIKTATDDLPKAVMAYRLDMGINLGQCWESSDSTGLSALANKEKVNPYTYLTGKTFAQAKVRWKGPYLKVGSKFDVNGGLIDENNPSVMYCYRTATGVAGTLGRTVDGGTDYIVTLIIYNGQTGGDSQRTYESLLAKIGDKKARQTPFYYNPPWYVLDVAFYQTELE
jgi:prepilin-type N-terminal cleavage/methylation domain-containing protein